jgi:hypothetical protein
MGRKRRALAVGLAALAVAASVAATGGFSAVTADRGVEVAVAPDGEAFLGIETPEARGAVGESVAVLRLRDNFRGDVDLERVSLPAPSEVVALRTTGPVEMEPTATVAVTCVAAGTERVTVEVVAGGPSTAVRADRTVTVRCTERGTETARPAPAS